MLSVKKSIIYEKGRGLVNFSSIRLQNALHDKLHEVTLQLYNSNLSRNEVQLYLDITAGIVKFGLDIIKKEVENYSQSNFATDKAMKENIYSLFNTFNNSFNYFDSDYKRMNFLEKNGDYIQATEYFIEKKDRGLKRDDKDLF